MKLEPLGDSAVVATLGSGILPETLASVLAWSEAIAAARGIGIVDVVAAYTTVTVFYDAARFTAPGCDAYGEVCQFLQSCAPRAGGLGHGHAATLVEIPVCYGGELGPDLAAVADRAGLGAADAAALHSGADYQVCAVGFTPGFPYLGGLPAALHTPRRDTPRPRVPAGSVGIGGAQTGVYPLSSPGGWQIIGRTPLALFRPMGNPAALLRTGDRVRFKPISQGEFESWK
jgi:inhibitor of KinA